MLIRSRMTITLEQAKDGASLIVTIVGLATLIKGVIEYVHQGTQKRAERFLEMRQRLHGNPNFTLICNLLENGGDGWATVSDWDKMEFLGLYEEVALMLNSGLISPTVAHYMFGYFAIKCSENEHFKKIINHKSPYWALFNDFVVRMKQEDERFSFSRRKLRF